MIVDAHCHAWATWPYQPPVPDPESRGRIEQLLFEMDQNGVSTRRGDLRRPRGQPG